MMFERKTGKNTIVSMLGASAEQLFRLGCAGCLWVTVLAAYIRGLGPGTWHVVTAVTAAAAPAAAVLCCCCSVLLQQQCVMLF